MKDVEVLIQALRFYESGQHFSDGWERDVLSGDDSVFTETLEDRGERAKEALAEYFGKEKA